MVAGIADPFGRHQLTRSAALLRVSNWYGHETSSPDWQAEREATTGIEPV
jgi:hypothetical protein